MPTIIDAAAIQGLQAAFREVALRAERMQEWVELAEQFRALDASYTLFSGGVRATAGQNAVDWNRLDELWVNCRDHDLPRFFDFIEQMKNVRLPLPSEPQDGRSTEVNTWSKELDAFVGQIQQAFQDQSAPQLRGVADGCQRLIKKHQAQHKHIMEREIRDLCILTDKLKERLEA